MSEPYTTEPSIPLTAPFAVMRIGRLSGVCRRHMYSWFLSLYTVIWTSQLAEQSQIDGTRPNQLKTKHEHSPLMSYSNLMPIS